ncbi:RlmE family RNA methyltransferase [Candidatus Thorarchaeota archaeon]|jgi:23S rRNA (uridine2552-2'-O)-methyltransferase|nr:MAG: RlmE family RNA methyltransferase [Candidatus Thorarchaeota archaeon]
MARRTEKERRGEHYYREAKKQGYRSRSAFKLKQIVKQKKLLRGVDRVVELCCAPGGWTQVLRELDNTLEIVAVDLNQMPPVRGVKFAQGDVLQEKTFEEIEKLTGGSADLVLSDCSPNVSGHWELDVARQLALVERTVEIAMKLLTSKGKVLAKIFQGPGFEDVLKETRQMFKSVRLIKPRASRRKSAEIYMLAVGPRLGKEQEESNG